MSREITNGTKEYADNLLQNTEKVLSDTLQNLEKEYVTSFELNANIIRGHNKNSSK